LAQDGVTGGKLVFTENMRMPEHKLIGDPIGDLVKMKSALLTCHLCVQDYLEQNVTKLLEKSFVILIIDRVDELVTLFQQMGLERCVSLLAVPRASILRSQFGYYFP
jgi:hypothetical protein